MNNSIKKFLSVGLAGVLASVSASTLAVNSFAVGPSNEGVVQSNRELVFQRGSLACYTCYIKTNRPDGLLSKESIADSTTRPGGCHVRPDDLDADNIIDYKVWRDEYQLILERIFDHSFLVKNGNKIDSVTVTDNNGMPAKSCRYELGSNRALGGWADPTRGSIFYTIDRSNKWPKSLTININFSE